MVSPVNTRLSRFSSPLQRFSNAVTSRFVFAGKVALPCGRLHQLLPHDGGPPRRSRLAPGVHTSWFEPLHRAGVRPFYRRLCQRCSHANVGVQKKLNFDNAYVAHHRRFNRCQEDSLPNPQYL